MSPAGELRVIPVAGTGAVIRRHGVIVVLGAPVADDLAGRVIEALEGAPGADALRALARLILDHHGEAGGAVVALGDHADVFAVGPFDLVVRGDRIAASQQILGLSQQLPLDDLVAVVPAGADVPPPPAWVDLGSGVVAGDGVGFAASEAPEAGGRGPAPIAESTGATPATGRFELVSLTASVDLSDRAPLPVTSAERPTEVVDAADLPVYMRPVTVRGVLSPRGYFNHPDATHCSRSGIEIPPTPSTDGVRPPLGVFTFDDGSTCSVQWNLVMGRDPRSDELVLAGEAAAYPVSDTELQVSRRHLRVELVGWEVTILDLNTANGTFVRVGGDGPRRLEPGERHRLVTGSEVMLGGRSFVYQEHHVR